MKISALFGTLVLAIIVSGCASNQHVYSSDGKCLTCWNNPITGKPINHDGKADQEQTAQASQIKETTTASTETTVVNTTTHKPTEHKIAFTVPVNVDVAFLKIKKEFKYYSSDEIRQEYGSLANVKMQSFEYHYDVMPSLYYHMREACEHDGIHLVVDSRIEKQSDSVSQIEITYWLKDPAIDPAKFGESLKSRTEKALSIE